MKSAILSKQKTTHGMAGAPHSKVYSAWSSMMSRCFNERTKSWANYGGRGIWVCERWREYANFLADMGARPPRYEIDRIDNDGPYSPENCRWVTSKANKHNKRSSRMLTWQGVTLPVTAWAERLGMHPRTLFNRLGRGWTLERAMTQPTNQKD
jgi:hypothetical protein